MPDKVPKVRRKARTSVKLSGTAAAPQPRLGAWRDPDAALPLGGAPRPAYPRNMFDKLLRGLMAPEPDPLPEQDARLALGALLVRIARSDGDYDTRPMRTESPICTPNWFSSEPATRAFLPCW